MVGVPHRRPGGTAAEVHGHSWHGPLVVLVSQVVRSLCVHQLIGKKQPLTVSAKSCGSCPEELRLNKLAVGFSVALVSWP